MKRILAVISFVVNIVGIYLLWKIWDQESLEKMGKEFSRAHSNEISIVFERERSLTSKQEVPNDVRRKLYDGDKTIELPRSYIVQHEFKNRGMELNQGGIHFSRSLIDALALSYTEIEDLEEIVNVVHDRVKEYLGACVDSIVERDEGLVIEFKQDYNLDQFRDSLVKGVMDRVDNDKGKIITQGMNQIGWGGMFRRTKALVVRPDGNGWFTFEELDANGAYSRLNTEMDSGLPERWKHLFDIDVWRNIYQQKEEEPLPQESQFRTLMSGEAFESKWQDRSK